MTDSELADKLQQLINEVAQRRDAGESIDPLAFIESNREHADGLRAYFEEIGLLTSNIQLDEDELDPGSTARIQHRSDTAVVKKTPPPADPDTSDDTICSVPEQTAPALGRYRIERSLGEGTMGRVFLAHDTMLDRKVALKLPKLGEMPQKEIKNRFLREARAAAALHHKNICTLFDIGEHEGQLYLTMAYIQGRCLSEFVESKKQQPEREVSKLVRKIAQGVAEAHRNGVIHRDLKPANIIVNEKGEPVVMDFGLARKDTGGDGKVTHEGMLVGSPSYMAPEQVEADGESVGPQTDIYSLGVITYELLTRQVPFTGTVMSILKQIAVDEPVPAIERRPDLDPKLNMICHKMMAKMKQDRYQSMDEVAEVLESFLKDESSTITLDEMPTIVERRAKIKSGTKSKKSSKRKVSIQPADRLTRISIRLLDNDESGSESSLKRVWRFKKGDTILIGRGSEPDVRVPNKRVSRNHAVIFFSAEQCWQFSNIGGNGSALDGERLEEGMLRDGTVIQLSIKGPRLQVRLRAE